MKTVGVKRYRVITENLAWANIPRGSIITLDKGCVSFVKINEIGLKPVLLDTYLIERVFYLVPEWFEKIKSDSPSVSNKQIENNDFVLDHSRSLLVQNIMYNDWVRKNKLNI